MPHTLYLHVYPAHVWDGHAKDTVKHPFYLTMRTQARPTCMACVNQGMRIEHKTSESKPKSYANDPTPLWVSPNFGLLLAANIAKKINNKNIQIWIHKSRPNSLLLGGTFGMPVVILSLGKKKSTCKKQLIS